jgi:hypothetical protein
MNHWWHHRGYPISRPWGDKMPNGFIDRPPPPPRPNNERFRWPLISSIQKRMVWRKTENVPLWSVGMDLSYKSPAVCCWNAQTKICWFIYCQESSKKSFLSTSSSTVYNDSGASKDDSDDDDDDDDDDESEKERKQKKKKKKKPDRWRIRDMGLLSVNERNNKTIHQVRFIRIQYPKKWVCLLCIDVCDDVL